MKSINELYDENGNYITDTRYQEILKLDTMLTEKGIPHTLQKHRYCKRTIGVNL